MKKVLAIFMTVVMIVAMFGFSTTAFAEDSKPVFVGYFGGKQANKTSLKQSTPNNGLRTQFLDADSKGAERVINEIDGYVESGEYSAIYIYVNSVAYTAPLVVNGVNGSAETPITILVANDSNGNKQTITFDNATQGTIAPTVQIKNCSYLTVSDISVTGIYTGMLVENCSNVTVDNVKFDKIGYVDYSFAQVIDQETGETATPDMETSDVLDYGAALVIGEGNENVTVSNCAVTSCRAGVIADVKVAEDVDKTPEASKGIEIKDCTFSKINENAVKLVNVENALVSGGSIEFAGDIALANNYDYRDVPAILVSGGSGSVVEACEISFGYDIAVSLDSTKSATIQRVYSHDNPYFICNNLGENADVRIRYNVSSNDGYSIISSEKASDVLVYNNTFVSSKTINMSDISGLVVKNNIFSMVIGEEVQLGEGEFGSNCYHWTGKAKGDSSSLKKNPQFANNYSAEDLENSVRDNFILSTESPCLGKGVAVEDDMGAKDFYGNEIGSTHNIGADDGAGAEASYKLVSQFSDSFSYIIALIRNFFANLFG